MERAVGDLRPDNRENGIQVSCARHPYFNLCLIDALTNTILFYDLGLGEMSRLSREPFSLMQIAQSPFLQ